MVKDFGTEYSAAKLKITLKLFGRYVGDIDQATLGGMGVNYSLLAIPSGIVLKASSSKPEETESIEYFVPYENVNYLVK